MVKSVKDLLINKCLIITVNDGNDVIQNGAIVVDKGIINYVGPSANLDNESYSKVIEGPYIVMPGLVNTHTHTPMSLFRGYADDMPLHNWLYDRIFPSEARLVKSDSYHGAMLSCAEMIKTGTTAFADMYFFMDEVARACVDSGMRASLSVGISSFENEEESLKRAEEFCRTWQGTSNGKIGTMLGPHAPYTCSTGLFKSVAELSFKLNVGIHIHLSETQKEFDDIVAKHKMTPTALIKNCGIFESHTLAAHCVVMRDEDIEMLAENGVFVAHNPTSNMKLASGISPVVKMKEHGITVGIGTDGPASNNTLDMFKEFRNASLLQKVALLNPVVLNAKDTIRMATIDGAKCLGLSDEIGSLEVGKKADLILLDFNKCHMTPKSDFLSHVAYSAVGSDVDTVLIDGKIVMENKVLKSIDETEIMARANEAFEKICIK